MNKLRLSYSLLTLWNNGRWEDAVKMYLHKDTFKTRQMREGLEMHKAWEKEIKEKNSLTIKSHTFKFKNPVCEFKVIAPYNKKWDMSGTFDVLSEDTIYEFKSGVMGSLEYSRGYQLPFYFLLAELSNISAKKGILIHYNQYTKEYDTTLLWNSKRLIKKAKNFIDSLAPEIEDYFVKHNISFDKQNVDKQNMKGDE